MWRDHVLRFCGKNASRWLRGCGCSGALREDARGSAQGHVFKGFSKHMNTVFMEVDVVMEVVEVQYGMMCQVKVWHFSTST